MAGHAIPDDYSVIQDHLSKIDPKAKRSFRFRF